MLSLWKGSGKSCWAGQGRRFNLRLGALNFHVWPTPACIFQHSGWETLALILTVVFIPVCSCKDFQSAKPLPLHHPAHFWLIFPSERRDTRWNNGIKLRIVSIWPCLDYIIVTEESWKIISATEDLRLRMVLYVSARHNGKWPVFV